MNSALRLVVCCIWLCFYILCSSSQTCGSEESFNEEVLFLPLVSDRVMIHLHFRLETPGRRHHTIYPRPLYQLSKLLLLEEFHLHFTQGRWRIHQYGASPLPTKPVGVELSAAFSRQLDTTVLAQQWGNLTHSLSGLFCASLNFMAGTKVVGQRSISMLPEGQPTIRPSTWLYATLPREAVCTENLTPWLRLLPCRDQAGPAALLQELSVASAEYYSMGVVLKTQRTSSSCSSSRQLPPSGELPQELTMSLTLVVKRSQLSSRLAAATAAAGSGSNLRSLLGGSCPVAKSSRMLVGHAGTGTPEGSISLLGCELGSCPGDVLAAAAAAMAVGTAGGATPLRGPEPHTQVHWHVAGPEGLHGHLIIHIMRPASASKLGQTPTAAAPVATLAVCIFQLVPWYLSVWLHTLQLHVDGAPLDLDAVTLARRLTTAQNRGRPLVLDLCLGLPANFTTATLSVRFDKQFLSVFEQPPDKDRGFDVPAAIVTLGSANATARWPWRTEGDAAAAATMLLGQRSPLLQLLMDDQAPEEVYSEALLVALPLPDASMPYNVICLTSTVLAVYVGATLNVLLKRPNEETEAETNAARKRRRFKIGAVLLVFSALAVYIDPGLQDQLQALATKAAKALGVGWGAGAAGH